MVHCIFSNTTILGTPLFIFTYVIFYYRINKLIFISKGLINGFLAHANLCSNFIHGYTADTVAVKQIMCFLQYSMPLAP